MVLPNVVSFIVYFAAIYLRVFIYKYNSKTIKKKFYTSKRRAHLNELGLKVTALHIGN